MTKLKQFLPFFFLGLALTLTTATYAQSRPGRGAAPRAAEVSAEERAQRMADRQKENLGLSEEQYQKVYEIHLVHARKHEAARADRQRDTEQRRANMEAIETSRDNELRQVLTEEQYQKYQQNRQQAADRVRERRQEAPQQRRRVPRN